MDRSWLNRVGKEEGLHDYYFKKFVPTKDYNETKLFIKHIDNESYEDLTTRIYNILESWFLHNKSIPQMIVLTKKDYINLLENTNVIEDDYIFGMKIDFFRKKTNDRKEKQRWNYN